ncbi:hypothetical protein Cni_G06060 [Canna indica]|uniref:Bulb-type lectin domain-containing protein n=1 Tax=Canna indica TaxID=4628 RepID=A0AAQ3JYI1_9LILI|nr:hypothetical protein Cni_G06060 [Canna indica]
MATVSSLLLFFFFFYTHALAVLAAAGNEVALFSHVKSILKRGESLSNNGSSLTLETDCDLVLRDANKMILWNSGSVDKGVECIFWVGKYGVAIVSDVDGSPLWTTGSPGPPGNYAILLRPDGKLRLYGPSIWTFERSASSASVVAEQRLVEAKPPSFDSSGYVMYSSEEFIYEPAVGVMLKHGNYSLVLETSCTIHIRRNNYQSSAEFPVAEQRPRAFRAVAPPCKTQLTTDGQLEAYKLLYLGAGGLDDVWLRSWGSNFTVLAKESIAALVDRGKSGELLIYPMKETIT